MGHEIRDVIKVTAAIPTNNHADRSAGEGLVEELAERIDAIARESRYEMIHVVTS